MKFQRDLELLKIPKKNKRRKNDLIMTAGYEQTSNTADSLGPGAPHHPAQLLKPPMKKAAVNQERPSGYQKRQKKGQRRRSRKGRPQCLRLARWPLALLRCPIWSRRWRHHSQTRSRGARCSAATAIISRPGAKTQTCTTEEAQHGRNASSIWWPLDVGKPVRQYFTRLLVQKYDSDSDI